MERSDLNRLRYFKAEDIPSWDKVDYMLMVDLERLVDRVGVKPRLTSTYRDPAHNQSVGGHPNSYHQSGRAADTDWGKANLLKAYTEARNQGTWGGLGLYYPEFVMHVDTGLKNAENKTRLWSRVGGASQPYMAITFALDKIKDFVSKLPGGAPGALGLLILIGVAVALARR